MLQKQSMKGRESKGLLGGYDLGLLQPCLAQLFVGMLIIFRLILYLACN